jgi:uncharacterized damage-inducible protein DinB
VKLTAWILVVASTVFAGVITHPAAQSPSSIQAEMLKDWSGLKDTMDKIANQMPDDKFSFKATPAQRDYGEQITHIAQANVGLLRSIGGKTAAPTIDPKVTGKAASIKAMDDSFDYGTALLKEQTDQTMLEAAQNPPRFMGPSSRARVYTFLIGHTWDIYGQMAVYLRLNGLVPPASQRP